MNYVYANGSSVSGISNELNGIDDEADDIGSIEVDAKPIDVVHVSVTGTLDELIDINDTCEDTVDAPWTWRYTITCKSSYFSVYDRLRPWLFDLSNHRLHK
jgi:hypothetical protein